MERGLWKTQKQPARVCLKCSIHYEPSWLSQLSEYLFDVNTRLVVRSKQEGFFFFLNRPEHGAWTKLALIRFSDPTMSLKTPALSFAILSTALSLGWRSDNPKTARESNRNRNRTTEASPHRLARSLPQRECFLRMCPGETEPTLTKSLVPRNRLI